MLPRIFLISGKKFHGKDTVASLISQEMVKRRLIGGSKTLSFAGPLKDAAKSIFRLSHDQCFHPDYKEVVDDRWGMTPREIMQKLGTEVGRQIHKDVWVLSALYNAKQYLAEYNGNVVFIPDTRFPNEVNLPRELMGDQVFTLRVTRPNLPPSEFDNHPSEIALDGFGDWDFQLTNDGDVDDLKREVAEFVNYLAEVQVNG